MCDIINQYNNINNIITNCMNTQIISQQETQDQTSQSMFVKMNIEQQQNYKIQEEEIKFIQDTQETVSTSAQISDESTVDGEEDNLQYIASEILKEKRTVYYQVKKQIVKKQILGTRQTENTKQKRWNQSEEVQFWVLLSQFGTNFDFISKELKTKTRKQIMLKFNREDKKNPAQVDQVLKGQLPSFITTTPQE